MQEKQVIFLKESGIIFLDLSLLYGRGISNDYEESPSSIGQGA